MPDTNPCEFGFKRLSLNNWLTVDAAWTGVLMSLSPLPQSEGMVNDLTQMQLDSNVPLQVRRLFETARGALVYSVLFYPLLALGAEQMLRVCETAASLKCELMSAPEIWKFQQKIDWLIKYGAIAKIDEERWKFIVRMRNDASHPSDQKIYNLALALEIMELTIELIESLFVSAG